VGTTDTQTLTNKTLTKATGTLQNVDIYNVGIWRTSVIGDSTNLTSDRMAWLDSEVGLNAMAYVGGNGRIVSINQAGDGDGTFRIRAVDTNGTTSRFHALSGGTIGMVPTTTTTQPVVDIVAPDTLATKRSIRIAASGGGTERFTVFNDGHISQVGQDPAQVQVNIRAAAAQSADIIRIQNSTPTTVVSVQNTGRFLANVGATVAQPGVLTGAILSVGGSNVGYTGNLQQWVNPANSIVASITESGNFATLGGASVSGVTSSGSFIANTVESRFVEDTATRTTTSTTYTATANPISQTIVVPPSGKVWVFIRETGRNSTTTNNITSFTAVGSSSGTVYSANDNAALIWSGNGTTNLSLSLEHLLSSLIAGETLTVTMQHRVSGASTATFDYRSIGLRGALS
jgi:hypothetical protein